jgi:hypothetical protein
MSFTSRRVFKMKRLSFALAILLLAVSCGSPKVGGFLDIKISDPEALVSIDDADPVRFADLDLPLDLMAIPHKVSVKWSQTGQTTVEYATVEYGKTVVFEPKHPEKVPVEIYSSIPGTIIAGKLMLGHSSKLGQTEVFSGDQRFEVTLDGFTNKWVTTQKVETGSKIRLEPGTDGKHGALYIKSESPGVEFEITGTDKEQSKFDGSIFIPEIVPGRLTITEKNNPGIKHYVEINAGTVTKLKYLTNFAKTDDRMINLDVFGKTTLYVCWGTQTTEIDLGNAKNITSYELSKKTPFRIGSMGIEDVFCTFACSDATGFGATSFVGKLPQTVKITRQAGSMADISKIKLADVQSWLPNSPDGRWTTNQNLIYGPGGYRFALGDYVPGCWDLKNNTVLVTKLDFDNKSFEVREAPLSKQNPMVIGSQGCEDVAQTGLDWIEASAFYDSTRLPLAVISSSKWTSIYRRTTGKSHDVGVFTLEKKLDKPSYVTSLWGKRHLVLRKGKSYFSKSFIYEIEKDVIADDIFNPSMTSSGLIAENASNGVNAGIIYKIVSGKPVPVWAGVYLPMIFVE